MENSPELKALIRQNAHLFWYTKDEEKENLPLPVVVEFFLNYAEADSVKKLFELEGINQVKEIFEAQINTSERVSNNYNPLSKNFYTLYFEKYAS
jgi:hypothetical protein